MNSLQPNFEIVKTSFYQLFEGKFETDCYVLFDTIIQGRLLPNFDNRLREFKKDFNQWLDRIDIRCVGELIKVIVEHGGRLPGWIKSNQFVIDYNDSQVLDLIRLTEE